MTNKKDNTQIIQWLEKEMNKNGLFFFKSVKEMNKNELHFSKPINDDDIVACFKNTGECFCVFYVGVIQRIIDEEEFESEGG